MSTRPFYTGFTRHEEFGEMLHFDVNADFYRTAFCDDVVIRAHDSGAIDPDGKVLDRDLYVKAFQEHNQVPVDDFALQGMDHIDAAIKMISEGVPFGSDEWRDLSIALKEATRVYRFNGIPKNCRDFRESGAYLVEAREETAECRKVLVLKIYEEALEQARGGNLILATQLNSMGGLATQFLGA